MSINFHLYDEPKVRVQRLQLEDDVRKPAYYTLVFEKDGGQVTLYVEDRAALESLNEAIQEAMAQVIEAPVRCDRCDYPASVGLSSHRNSMDWTCPDCGHENKASREALLSALHQTDEAGAAR